MDAIAHLTDNVFVRRALLILGLATSPIFVASAPATAQTVSPKSACGLLSSAQASSLLRSSVVQQSPGGVAPTECWFVVTPLPSPGGIPTQINLRLSRGQMALHDFNLAVNPETKVLPARANLPGETATVRRHFVKVAGVSSYWIRIGVSEISSGVIPVGADPPWVGTDPPALPFPTKAHGATFASSKHGFVIQISVQGVSDPEQVAKLAMGDVLQSL